jgi:hypothetical protein
MTQHRRRATALAAALALIVITSAACGSDKSTTGTERSTSTRPAPTTGSSDSPDSNGSTAPDDSLPDPVIDPGDGGRYEPKLDPADFVDVVDNPYLPFVAGSTWVYEGESEGEPERVEVTVLDERKTILGISATVVRDTVTVEGQVVEDTHDWYAQDREGNVWYLGEAVKDFEDGKLTSTDGSFEVGVDGALPGIVMPAHPTVGHAYRQEYYRGEAEDMAEVLEIDARVEVPFGTFDRVVVTRDWNPLDPEPVEEKSYAPGVGLIYETHTRGPAGSIELVAFTPAG